MRTKKTTNKGKGKPELPRTKYQRTPEELWEVSLAKRQVESTADFKARLRAMNPRPAKTSENSPCVRTPEDSGYYPPERKKPHSEAYSARNEATNSERDLLYAAYAVLDADMNTPAFHEALQDLAAACAEEETYRRKTVVK